MLGSLAIQRRAGGAAARGFARRICSVLASAAASRGGRGCALPNPLDTVRAANYSHSSERQERTNILNWNIDRGKHLDQILAAIRDTQAHLCIFQEG